MRLSVVWWYQICVCKANHWQSVRYFSIYRSGKCQWFNQLFMVSQTDIDRCHNSICVSAIQLSLVRSMLFWLMSIKLAVIRCVQERARGSLQPITVRFTLYDLAPPPPNFLQHSTQSSFQIVVGKVHEFEDKTQTWGKLVTVRPGLFYTGM